MNKQNKRTNNFQKNNQNNKNIDKNQDNNKQDFSNSNNQNNIQDIDEVKILLFPGEEYEFNEKLINYDAFGYRNGNLTSKRCGYLICDKQTNKPKEDNNEQEIYRSLGNYYSPREEDFVIGTIVYKASEFYKIDIGSYTYAQLNAQNFEGVTKKTKPNLNLGDLVFAKVGKLNKFDAPQLTCISEHQSKNWASGESYFGVLKGGMVFNFPKIYSWDLFESETIKRLQDIITFEIAIGFNGKIWINSEENIYDIYNIIKSSLAMNKSEVEKIIHETFIDKMKVD